MLVVCHRKTRWSKLERDKAQYVEDAIAKRIAPHGESSAEYAIAIPPYMNCF
jgi:hypothetical protein